MHHCTCVIVSYLIQGNIRIVVVYELSICFMNCYYIGWNNWQASLITTTTKHKSRLIKQCVNWVAHKCLWDFYFSTRNQHHIKKTNPLKFYISENSPLCMYAHMEVRSFIGTKGIFDLNLHVFEKSKGKGCGENPPPMQWP